ncbi:2'-5' RNA ligase superfamily protein [Micromonospora viridifaciens]|uniref:2'-5' RNA ligase superfamily protein n=1 Tax=Micromonospora viridifaciens TaxID=1881 RepID=A0A1C4YMN8_MICVI|nr:2'-5' RNA ligase family protein [Micromonospora viridifaciens]SCF21940.1 2'-5' RNA ligase superfamily protein [Micromonospora viridifaciens]
MRTVELLCSPELEGTVRSTWHRLAEAGLPSLAGNVHPTNRPHLTLAAVDAFPPGAEQRLADLCAAALPLPAHLDRVAVLDGSAPLVWLVRRAPQLVALHGAVWDVLAEAPGPRPWHLPGRWIPHLSLALRFRDADRRRARAVAGLDRPVGKFVAARSYDSDTRTVSDLSPADPRLAR